MAVIYNSPCASTFALAPQDSSQRIFPIARKRTLNFENQFHMLV